MYFLRLLKYSTFILIFFHFNLVGAKDSISYIDMDFIMNNSLAGKSILKQIDKKNQIIIDSFKKTEEKLLSEEKKIVSQKNILNPEEYNKKIKLFSDEVAKYRKDRQSKISNLAKKRMLAQANLIESITPILTDYSSKNSISYILPKKNIIIGKSELDITKIILDLLDSKVKNIKVK